MGEEGPDSRQEESILPLQLELSADRQDRQTGGQTGGQTGCR